MKDLISIAKIINFHGIKGEVKVGFTKGHEHQISTCKKVFFELNKNIEELNIESVRFHKTFAIIKFKELNSINETQIYKNIELLIPKETVTEFLESDEYLVSDLKGLDAFDLNENFLGKVFEIGENNATSIISIKDSKDKVHLIPFVKELVPLVDIKNKKIVINNIEGLIN